MNCRRFQHEIYEYLDGSLSLKAQAAAEQHLADCEACRHVVEAERAIAQRLAQTFRAATQSLRLPPEVGRRVAATVAKQGRASAEPWGGMFSWPRWVWPLAATAAALLLLGGYFYFVGARGPELEQPRPRPTAAAASIQFSYVVPTYTFRREGGFVVDALTYQTNVVNQKIQVELARLE